MTIYIGTSGFSYDDWRGKFYPENLERKEWLRFYAEHFNTTELNVTFYRTPFEAMFKSWWTKTPDKFLFSVKGSRFITHVKRLKDVDDSVKYFYTRVRLLKEKLGPVLWQFPAGFKPDIKKFSEFLRIIKKLKIPHNAFEFRNPAWLDDKILNLVRDSGNTICISDFPRFETGSLPGFEFYYIRRHGPKNSSLYSGCYTRDQIKRDAEMIKKNILNRTLFVYYNNDVSGYAIKNAKELKEFLNL